MLILDEPTSALERAEHGDAAGRAAASCASAGSRVVFVSHILEEVLALCDEVTVLRDGRAVARAACRERG